MASLAPWWIARPERPLRSAQMTRPLSPCSGTEKMRMLLLVSREWSRWLYQRSRLHFLMHEACLCQKRKKCHNVLHWHQRVHTVMECKKRCWRYQILSDQGLWLNRKQQYGTKSTTLVDQRKRLEKNFTMLNRRPGEESWSNIGKDSIWSYTKEIGVKYPKHIFKKFISQFSFFFILKRNKNVTCN